MKKTAWITGASSGLGRQLAESLASLGFQVIVSARNSRDLEALCQHIRIKYNGTAQALPFDLATIKNESDAMAILNKVHSWGRPDACYFIAGNIHADDESLKSISTLENMMQVNFTGPVYLLNETIRQHTGTALRIVVASSVATIRARGKNIAYGTAKRALEQYCSGLMHALAGTSVTIQVYRLGYMDTNLSYGQKLPFRPASVLTISKKLIDADRRDSGIYYLPRFWMLISWILQAIPFAIYKKMKF